MKNTNFKTLGVFISVILLLTLLNSCNKSLENSDVTFEKNPSNQKIEKMDKPSELKEKTMMQDDQNKWSEEETKMMDQDKNITKNDDMKKDETKMMDGEKTMTDEKVGVYSKYSPELVKNASGNIVLFFHADWCPTCVSIEKNILSTVVPANLTLLKVDYDNSDDLKTKYGVLTQTTFVEIDNKGNMIKKWIGARDLNDIVKKIK